MKWKGHESVFVNPETWMSLHRFKIACAALNKRVELKGIRFHDLRHTFATYFILNGGDIISLKEILGHEDIKTTSRYAHATSEGMRSLVNKFQVNIEKGELVKFEKQVV